MTDHMTLELERSTMNDKGKPEAKIKHLAWR
jgi:hypothetical protein